MLIGPLQGHPFTEERICAQLKRVATTVAMRLPRKSSSISTANRPNFDLFFREYQVLALLLKCEELLYEIEMSGETGDEGDAE